MTHQELKKIFAQWKVEQECYCKGCLVSACSGCPYNVQEKK